VCLCVCVCAENGKLPMRQPKLCEMSVMSECQNERQPAPFASLRLVRTLHIRRVIYV